MKISFKEINNGLANEIFVKDELIGTVTINMWTQKWEMKPIFDLGYYAKDRLLNKKFDSAYEAGKEMQRLHEMASLYNEYNDPSYDDTQDIDMRDMFKTIRIP
tara:strand:+ start:68 stop:376 length:309 start_codon:yes stop_codon:yes gene_type:complete